MRSIPVSQHHSCFCTRSRLVSYIRMDHDTNYDIQADHRPKGLLGRMKARKRTQAPIGHGSIVSVTTDELDEKDIIIAVMGPTGAGKSSFINMATGNKTGVGHELESYTSSIQIIKFRSLEINIEILTMVADWLKSTYERNVKLAGILYFHRISDNRMAGTPLKNLHIHNERYAVELQEELVDMKQGLPETKAGQELYGKLQALVSRQHDTLQKIRASMKRHDDETILSALREEYEDLRKQGEVTVRDMEALKIPIGKRLRRFFTSRLGFLIFKKR
ncbi:hypothetical protein AB1N83_006536 [Pleurotus pulmonarius]